MGEAPGGEREPQQDDEGDQRPLTDPHLAPGLLATVALLGQARPQERLLAGAEPAPSVQFVGPRARGLQPGTAVEGGGVAALALPVGGRLGQLLVGEEPGPVGMDPAAQPRPGVQQGLMGDVNGVTVHGDQPGPYEGVQRGGGDLRVPHLLQQGVPCHPAPGRPGSLGHVHQSGQQPADRLLLGRVEAGEHVLGGPRDRSVDAAGALVPGDGQHGSVPLLPGGEQRVGEEGQRAGRGVAGLAGSARLLGPLAQPGVPQQEFHQARFEGDARQFRGTGDRLA